MDMISRILNKGLYKTGLALAAVALTAMPSFAADVFFVAREYTKTMPDGASVAMWGFAQDADNDLATIGTETPSSPGPLITVPGTDTALNIHLRNELPVPVSLVIPGQTATLTPVKFTDAFGRQRAQSFTHETAPGSTGTYSWSGFKAGACIYQSGTHPAVQVQMGLYGGVKKNASQGAAYNGSQVDSSYDSEAVIFYSEIDAALHDAVSNGTYGTAAYPGTINYKPDYSLVNGEPYSPSALPIDAGELNKKVLLRFFNAGQETHVPELSGAYMRVIAEDGNVAPYAKEQYSVLLPAGKTMDAVFSPKKAGKYPLFDRRLYLSNMGSMPGGMLSYLEVKSPQTAPVAANDIFEVNEDSTLSVDAPGVLSNDNTNGNPSLLSIDSGALLALQSSNAGSGALTLNANGSFTYTPSPDFTGTDFFRYRASDGTLESNEAIVQITVAQVNDAPVAAGDSAVTVQETPATIDVLANDTDMDRDALSVKTLANGPNGLATLNANGTVNYAPNAGFTGVDAFTYVATDGTADSNAATVTVTVNPRPNLAPVAVDDYARARRNSFAIINVLANDSDPDGALVPSTVELASSTTTRGGLAFVNANGTITYIPARYFRGTDTFTYTVRDDKGAVSNSATVRINVTLL